MRVLLLQLCVMLLLTSAAGAETLAWNMIGGGQWEEAANWLPGKIPAPGDDVILDGTGPDTITFNSYAAVSTMKVKGANKIAFHSGKLSLTTPSFALAITRAGNGSGTVTTSPAAIDCGTICSAAFDKGSVVALVPAAAAGSIFTGWSAVDCPGSGTCYVTIDAATNVTATFMDPAPSAAFAVSPVSPTVNKVIQFTDASTGGATSWSWSFGDGAASTAQNPTHAYSAAGNYTVTLTASDAGGTSTASQNVVVSTLPETFRPCGLYILDSRGSALRDGNIRDYPWVRGYVLRLSWNDIEQSPGVYDFSLIDNALERVAAIGQHLTLLILGPEPDHVTDQAVETWHWVDTNPNHPDDVFECTANNGGCDRPLPWDEPTQNGYRAMVQALALHQVRDGADFTTLANHPRLDTLALPLPGWDRVRELGFEVESWPGYAREKLKTALLSQLQTQTAGFPRTPLQVGWWPVKDDDHGVELWKELYDAVKGNFGTQVILEQENLKHSFSAGVDTFGPLPEGLGEPLVSAANSNGYSALQMLTSWAQPFTSGTAGGSPIAAMDWARATYGTRYFEIYVSDADAAQYDPLVAEWKAGFERLSVELCQ